MTATSTGPAPPPGPAQPPGPDAVPPGRRPATEEEARALASAVRLRILRLCLDQPRTNKEIADRLGANPATVLHHVRTLVRTGFLVPQPPRRGPRGSREVPYLATRKSWWLDTTASTPALFESLLGEYERVRDPASVRVVRLGLWLTPQEYRELQTRLASLFDELAARPRTPEGRPYSLFCALLPDVDREDQAAAPSAAD